MQVKWRESWPCSPAHFQIYLPPPSPCAPNADATDAGDTTVVTGVTAPSTSTLTAVEVQVKRRETERQQQARLNSYAYLHQKEAEEQWSELTVSPCGCLGVLGV